MGTSNWRLCGLLGLNLAFIVGVLTGFAALSIVTGLVSLFALGYVRHSSETLTGFAPLTFCLVWLPTESVLGSTIAELAMVAVAILAEVWRSRRWYARMRAEIIAAGRADAKRLGVEYRVPVFTRTTRGQRAA